MKLIHALSILFLSAAIGCSSGLGDPCEEADDCRDIPGGYCAITGVCTVECVREGAVCQGDGLCAFASRRRVCLPQCVSNEDCRPSDTCTATVGGSACVLTDFLAEP